MTKRDSMTKDIYPGGIYQLKKTVFEELEDLCHVKIKPKDCLFPHFAIFDLESICFKDKKPENSETINCIGTHLAVSASVASSLNKNVDFICEEEERAGRI